MKFRGKMIESVCIKQFSNIVTTLAKLSKSCVLRICTDKIFFIIAEESAVSGRPMVWCVLEQAHFFNEYHMVGVSDTHNEIFLEFSADMLAKSLNTLRLSQAAKSVKIKLTNKKSPCLTFEIELPSLTHSRLCVHDIPVTVIARRQWVAFQEPDLPNFDVSIEMPNLKLVRNVVERMRSLSPHLILSANLNGEFLLKIEADMVTVTTHFKDLPVEPVPDRNDDSGRLISARVDIKKFGLFLASEQVHPNKIVCNIIGDRMVHLFLVHEDVTLHYFLPSITS